MSGIICLHELVVVAGIHAFACSNHGDAPEIVGNLVAGDYGFQGAGRVVEADTATAVHWVGVVFIVNNLVIYDFHALTTEGGDAVAMTADVIVLDKHVAAFQSHKV